MARRSRGWKWRARAVAALTAGALLVTGWLLWRTRPQPPGTAGEAEPAAAPEITSEERRGLEEVLRQKSATP